MSVNVASIQQCAPGYVRRTSGLDLGQRLVDGLEPVVVAIDHDGRTLAEIDEFEPPVGDLRRRDGWE